MKLSIKRKVNHDSLWLKAQSVEHKNMYAKLHISRSGVRVTYMDDEMKNVADKMINLFETFSKTNNYGTTLELIEKKLKMEKF